MKKMRKPATHYVTFFSRTVGGQVKVWSCWIEGDGITVTSSWGIKGGKMQTTSDTMTSRGRHFSKGYKTPQQVALEEHKRQVEKKMRAGYVEAEERAHAVQLEQLKSDLDFDKLPRTFAPAKPVREIDPALAAQWDKAGLLNIQRKRDGMRHYIVKGDGPIRVYSRGMDDMSVHFARLTQELDLPNGTILDAEFVVTTPRGNNDNFIAVSEICRSKPDRAARTMISYEHKGYTVQFLVFDLLFYDRVPTWQLPYRDRYNALIDALELAHDKEDRAHFNHVVVMPRLTKPLSRCIRRVQKRGWEGLVLWRADQSTQVHMNRSPKRINCYKFKPMVENDFVATGYELGKGRNGKVVGALTLGIYGHAKGMLVPMGNVGTGFSDKQRVEALRWKYPCVVEVKYEKMSETGLRFPSFLRKRDDKRPKECKL